MNIRKIHRLNREKPRLNFYSEGLSNWVHFEEIIEALCLNLNEEVIYITSSAKEVEHLAAYPGIIPFYIQDGNFRTILFASLSAPVLVMTMPDLNNYHLKRSWNDVHYVYIHHSIVSTHMIYQAGAFDHFDTIFCVGDHHVREISAREKHANLKPKRLFNHGYGRLDRLIRSQIESENIKIVGEPLHILIAPSWGPNSLLERHDGKFLQLLLDAGYKVTLRPHFQTSRHIPDKLDRIYEQLKNYKNFVVDEGMDSTSSLLSADIMVSDWSGVALEFTFSRLKPVIFVDVPRKVNNKTFESLGMEPLEVWIRTEIGVVIAEDQLENLAEIVKRLIAEESTYASRIIELREQHVYNVAKSGLVGAQELLRILHKDL